jgi:lipopolysaccharide cholinephosphotransferase
MDIKKVCQYPIPDKFLEAEERNGYLVSAKMKRVWAVQMDLMQKLLDVCKKHGLRIWAEGGTLLGAVREKGWIPWDDDMDFVMLRKDYDRLVQMAPEEFSSPYYFQHWTTEKRYARGIAQIRMDNTSGILDFHGEMFIFRHQGIYIEVLPMDEIPDDQKAYRLWKEEYREKIYALKSSVNFDMLHPFNSLKWMRNFDKLAMECDNCAKRYDDGSHDNVAILVYKVKHTHKKSWFDDTVYLPFEYLTIPAPSGYHEVLRQYYGDYMTPVQCESPHIYWKLDPDTDYHSYLREQKKMFRKKRRKNLVRRIRRVLKR